MNWLTWVLLAAIVYTNLCWGIFFLAYRNTVKAKYQPPKEAE